MICEDVAVVLVDDEMLKNFTSFMTHCKEKNYSNGKGVFKVRLKQSVQRCSSLPDITKRVQNVVSTGVCKIQNQEFDAFSLNENIYAYRPSSVPSKSKIANYFMKMLNHPDTFSDNQTTCCSVKLEEDGTSGLMTHYWEEIRKKSNPVQKLFESNYLEHLDTLTEVGRSLKQNFTAISQSGMKFSSNLLGVGASQKSHPWNDLRSMIAKNNVKKYSDRVSQTGSHDSPETTKIKKRNVIMYGAGIHVPTNDPIYITKSFSLAMLGTILDVHPDQIPGVNCPSLYVGMPHSTTPMHEEDSSLQSINFLHFGAPKIWVVVPPEYVLVLIECLSATELPASHTSCVYVLGHKIAVIDTAFLLKNGIPFSVIVQRPGEFIVIEPNAAHTVFNCGWNIAEAVNFALESWIRLGIYARKCECRKEYLQLDMTPFLAMYLPNLLEPFLKGEFFCSAQSALGQTCVSTVRKLMVMHKGASLLQPEEPQENSMNGDLEDTGTSLFQLGKPENSLNENIKTRDGQSYHFRKRSVLECIACGECYEGGRCKLPRLLKHCKTVHPAVPELEELTKARYPPRELKKEKKLLCNLCGCLYAGGPSNLKIHLKNMHPETQL